MDILDILRYILLPIVVGVLGYQQHCIHRIQERVNDMATRNEMLEHFREQMIVYKDKMDDNLTPIAERLDRIESKLDEFIKLKLMKNKDL